MALMLQVNWHIQHLWDVKKKKNTSSCTKFTPQQFLSLQKLGTILEMYSKIWVEQ